MVRFLCEEWLTLAEVTLADKPRASLFLGQEQGGCRYVTVGRPQSKRTPLT